MVKNSSTKAGDIETGIRSLGWKIPWRRAWHPFQSCRIPWTEETGGLQSTESYRVRQDWSDLAWAHTHTHFFHNFELQEECGFFLSEFTSDLARYMVVLLVLGLFKPEVPNLWVLRWSWRNNNRNKAHNKCNAFESSRNHSRHAGPWKKCFPQTKSLVPKRFRTAALN